MVHHGTIHLDKFLNVFLLPSLFVFWLVEAVTGQHGVVVKPWPERGRMPHPSRRRELAVGKTISIRIEPDEVVEAWRGTGWQCLIPSESLEIVRKRDACIRAFDVWSTFGTYHIDLDAMTRTDKETGRIRSIRFTFVEILRDSGIWDFDKCRDNFCKMASAAVDAEQLLTMDDLLSNWPFAVEDDDLLGATVREAP